jgi:hypothetical protein
VPDRAHGGALLAGGARAELPVDLVTLDELDVLGIRSSPNAYPAMIALLASGAIRTEPLTAHVYPLADVATAFGALERREAIRPILIPDAGARHDLDLHPRLLRWLCPWGQVRALVPPGPLR